MRITKIETIQLPELTRYLWVRIHTDEGLIGLGETYVHAEAARAMIENVYAPQFLLGKDPLQIEAHWQAMFERSSFAGWAGAEMRAISAIDIALWDLLGQYTRQPIYRLLGGECHPRLRIYNTCRPGERFDFHRNPVELAQDLLESGIRAMKIYPFDRFALKSAGQMITLEDLEAAITPIREIGEHFGNAIEVAIEFHGHWNLPSARRIARALETYQPLWLEDLMNPDDLDAYETLVRQIRVPLIMSERLMTRYQFLPILQRGLAQIINPDVEWCGGISEAKKIATLAETFHIPVAFHNYGGPILNFASAHVAASLPNFMILETGRDLLEAWTAEFLTEPVRISDGSMLLPKGSGLGTSLSPSLLQRDDLILRVIQ
jgi:galactonate dehydratase